MSSSTDPRWMSRVLIAAALYNGLWGAWAILWPQAMFHLAGMEPPRYPQLWQCIGMIVGVYGVGYGIASTHPARHWPLVLVGLLGKVLGPLGMAQALWTGALPWKFALTCLPNDLIWWLPFALILRHAWTVYRLEDTGEPQPEEGRVLEQAMTNQGDSLAALSQLKPVLLVMLRHSGCSFCRNAMADLSRLRPRIENVPSQLVIGHMTSAAEFVTFAERYGLSDVAAIADPKREIYRGLGLRRAGLLQLIGPRVWGQLIKACARGHFAGPLLGDAAQMPGAFLIHQNRVVRRYQYRDASDKPDYVGLAVLPV